MKLAAFALFGILAMAAGGAHATQGIGCGDLRNAFGPFDYRTIPAQPKDLVERAHFTLKVETLTAGMSGYLGGDIDYTLRAIPNHPHALLSMERLGLKLKTDFPRGARYPVPCYFDRAIRFVPDDPMPHMIYAIYLKDHGKRSEAVSQLDIATSLKGGSDNPDFAYDVALLYLDLGEKDKALKYAHHAYALGAQLPGLKAKLQAAGAWKE